MVPALAVWPKLGGGGIVLAEPMFDHSKVAIIDDIVRLGLPPGNPFFGGLGAHSGLAYYYLWHFSAAMLGALVGASGWEADIALTWFTAFASLALMIGFAAKLSGRRLAPLLVVLLSLAASLRPVLRFVLGPHFLGRALSPEPWPQAWIFQASWAPQHLASAGCVVIAVLILSRLAAPRSWPWFRCSPSSWRPGSKARPGSAASSSRRARCRSASRFCWPSATPEAASIWC